MKALELTKDDRRRLIEMCNVFFPEYKKIEFENSGMITLFRVNLTPTKEYNYIHWFEFCHCYLLPKLIVDRNSRLQFYMDTFTGNPIDYLYFEFSKLK